LPKVAENIPAPAHHFQLFAFFHCHTPMSFRAYRGIPFWSVEGGLGARFLATLGMTSEMLSYVTTPVNQ
jgi:hypothetical protein